MRLSHDLLINRLVRLLAVMLPLNKSWLEIGITTTEEDWGLGETLSTWEEAASLLITDKDGAGTLEEAKRQELQYIHHKWKTCLNIILKHVQSLYIL